MEFEWFLLFPVFVDALFLEALRGMLISGPVLLNCSGNFVTRQKDANLFEFICDLFYIKRRTYGNFESFCCGNWRRHATCHQFAVERARGDPCLLANHKTRISNPREHSKISHFVVSVCNHSVV